MNIITVTLNGKTRELSINTQLFGPSLIWDYLTNAKEQHKEILDDIHALLCAIYYGGQVSARDHKASQPTPVPITPIKTKTKYQIRRYYSDDTPTEVIKTVDTVEEARRHCSSHDTKGTVKSGASWFDGFTEVTPTTKNPTANKPRQ